MIKIIFEQKNGQDPLHTQKAIATHSLSKTCVKSLSILKVDLKIRTK